jgi:hypothetical protein
MGARTAAEASDAFLKRVKVDVNARRVVDRRAILNDKARYDVGDYAARIGLAEKAQKVLNRVAYALRQGQLDANALDVKKLQSIAGEALGEPEARLTMRNLLSTAYHAGVYDEGMSSSSKVYFHYRTKGDDRVRPAHRRWDKVLLPKTHKLVPVIMPPNGHNCRCVGTFVTAAEAQGLLASGEATSKKPPVVKQTYIDKITGKRMKTVEGVDPGWATPPSDRAEVLGKLLERQLLRLERTVADYVN